MEGLRMVRFRAVIPDRKPTPRGAAMNLSELIARVEKATGPDIRLDFLIHDGLYGDRTGGVVPRVTESLDAVVALVKRELPGCSWNAWNRGRDTNDRDTGPGATLWHGTFPSDWSGGDVHNASTPALALLLAFLRAKVRP
jgi:hypothetical protein